MTALCREDFPADTSEHDRVRQKDRQTAAGEQERESQTRWHRRLYPVLEFKDRFFVFARDGKASRHLQTGRKPKAENTSMIS